MLRPLVTLTSMLRPLVTLSSELPSSLSLSRPGSCLNLIRPLEEVALLVPRLGTHIEHTALVGSVLLDCPLHSLHPAVAAEGLLLLRLSPRPRVALIAAVIASEATTCASASSSSSSSASSARVCVGLSRHLSSPGPGRPSRPRASVVDRGGRCRSLGSTVEPLNAEHLQEVGVTASEAAGVLVREEGGHGPGADSDADQFRIVLTSLTLVIAH